METGFIHFGSGRQAAGASLSVSLSLTDTHTHSQSAGRNPLLPVQYTSIIDEYFLLASPFLTLPISLSISLSLLPCLSFAPALPAYPSFNLVVLFSVGLYPDLLRCLLAVCLPPFLGVKQHHVETGEQHRHRVTDSADTNYNSKAEV